MDTKLKERHFSILAKGKVDRKRYIRKLGLATLPLLLSIFGLTYSESLNAPGFVITIFSVALAPSMLFLLFYGYRVLGRIINPLDNLDRAFESLYEAVKSYDEAPNFYDLHVQQDIYNVLESAFQNLQEPKAIERFLEEPADLLDRTDDNIEKRLLPAAREGKINKQTVESLTKILSAPSIDSLREFNSEVEASYEEKEKAGLPVRREVSKFLRSKAGKLASSLALGFGIITAISILYSIAVGEDTLIFFGNNPALVLGSGIALTVGLLAFLRE